MKAKERHDIKTDRFLEIMMFIEDFAVRNAKAIIFSVIAIVVVIAAAIGVLWYMDANEGDSARAFNLLLPDVTMVLNAENPETTAVNKVTADLRGIIATHGGSAAGIQAEYYLGMVLLKQNNTEGALEQFRAVAGSNHHWFSSVAAAQVGEILAGEGKFKDAAEQFAAIVNRNDTSNALAYYAWKAGQYYEKAGDKNQALLYFNKAKEVQNLGLDSALLATIERHIQELGAAPVTAKLD